MMSKEMMFSSLMTCGSVSVDFDTRRRHLLEFNTRHPMFSVPGRLHSYVPKCLHYE